MRPLHDWFFGPLLLLATGTASAPCAAEAVEQVLHVPVRLANARKGEDSRDMLVTVIHESSRRRAPFVLILHGRPADPAAFARIGIQSYPANARWLMAQGFSVVIPTRIGYGRSPGPDLENAGSCAAKNYAGALQTMRSEVAASLAALSRASFIDTRHGVVIGESFGALGALTLADGSIPAVLGVINFAGGDGGDTVRLDQPCATQAVTGLFEALGRQARTPSLWLYSRNDRLWGPDWPRRWFAAWRAGGSKTTFVDLPEVPGNGHFVFNRHPLDWHAPVLQFLRSLPLVLPPDPP